MWLLDPDMGAQRRGRLKERVEQGLQQLGVHEPEGLDRLADSASDAATDAVDSAAGAVADVANRAEQGWRLPTATVSGDGG
jgi:hypothetical protein